MLCVCYQPVPGGEQCNDYLQQRKERSWLTCEMNDGLGMGAAQFMHCYWRSVKGKSEPSFFQKVRKQVSAVSLFSHMPNQYVSADPHVAAQRASWGRT